MKIGAFLLALVGPLLSRILAALGMTLITLTGLSVAISTVKGELMTGLSGLPLDAMKLLGLFGAWHALAIVLAAITFLVAWQTTKGFASLVKA